MPVINPHSLAKVFLFAAKAKPLVLLLPFPREQTTMKIYQHLISPTVVSISLCLPSLSSAVDTQATNIKYPSGLTHWRVIGTSFRNDNDTQRVILENTLAIKAARANTKKTQ